MSPLGRFMEGFLRSGSQDTGTLDDIRRSLGDFEQRGQELRHSLETTESNLAGRLDSLTSRAEGLETALTEITRKLDVLLSSRQIDGLALVPGKSDRPASLSITEDLSNADLYSAVAGEIGSTMTRPGIMGLGSTLCRQAHMTSPECRYWLKQLNISPSFHRKYWEYFFIAQSLFEADMLRAGRRGLVFGVGEEQLPALFAKLGCDIVATDQVLDEAAAQGWTDSSEHSADLSRLNMHDVCPPDVFADRVSFAAVDMNDIPSSFDGLFDFCWSSCCLEHLGSLEHGLQFVLNSMRTLRPGGIAVHTTEFNLGSNHDTLESPAISLYRRRDIVSLLERLTATGARVDTPDLDPAIGFVDGHVDVPPFKSSAHLRLELAGFECTSIGLVIHKAG